jgi:hypothetical protein
MHNYLSAGIVIEPRPDFPSQYRAANHEKTSAIRIALLGIIVALSGCPLLLLRARLN